MTLDRLVGYARAVPQAADSAPPRLRLRGRSFIAVALVPEPPLAFWLARLDGEVARSPSFFTGRPVILDLSAAPLDAAGLRMLLAALAERAIRVLGIEGADEHVRLDDIPGCPPALSGGRSGAEIDVPDPAPGPVDEPASLVLNEPVRSGQSVVFPRGDVTIVGSVGSGAEIMAGGSIHIYGALRGRAVAGIMGDARARIFCRRLEAELIAIDGLYRTADDIDPALRGRPVQAWLDGDSIAMAGLD